MNYFTIDPPESLIPFVRFFWGLECDTIQGSSYVHRSMADGCAELLFHYKGVFEELTECRNIRQTPSLIHAQSSRYRRFLTFENFGIFGAYLYPYTIPLLFNLPSYDISSHMIDLDTLLGREGKELEERIMLAHDTTARVKLLTGFLEKRLKDKPDLSVFSSIRQVIHSGDVPNIDHLASGIHLSRRQFERKFKEYAGFSPKLFSRIIRFNAACNHYGSRYKSLTEIAHDCGYYDQSHFIHDFKEFSGYHPKQYFSGKAEGTGYREV